MCEEPKQQVSRRGFLGFASAALAATGLFSSKALAHQEPAKKANNPFVTNPTLDAANPDSSNPPVLGEEVNGRYYDS